MNVQYNLQFEKLCASVKLGILTKTPKAISGGLLHRMYTVETNLGKYAVKALNPQILARVGAQVNYVRSEQIARHLSSHIPAHPANLYGSNCLILIDQQYYLIFDWIEGKSLDSSIINEENCRQIGKLLAQIHNTEMRVFKRSQTLFQEQQVIPWNLYLTQGREHQTEWFDELSNHMHQLAVWNKWTKDAAEELSGESVISHRDLEPKNIMWSKGKPTVIDWESAGEIHPKHDLVETAIYWSIQQSGLIDQTKFHAFIEAYQEYHHIGQTDWKRVLDLGYAGKLEWLEYSLKRSLGIECADGAEQEMGTKQVISTLRLLKEYEQLSATLAAWLNDISE